MSDHERDLGIPLVARVEALQTERWIRMMALLVIGGPILLALNVGVAVKTHIDSDNTVKLVRQGVSCMFADLDDHRHTNQYAHQEIANALGLKINQPDVIPLTKEQAQALKESCVAFIHGSLP